MALPSHTFVRGCSEPAFRLTAPLCCVQSTPTGKCAVLVTADGERSLITDLQAANNYKIEHFNEEAQQAALSAAKIVYSSGFFMTVCADAMVAAATEGSAEGFAPA